MDMPTHWTLVTAMERSRSLIHLDREATGYCVPYLAGYGAHHQNSSNQGNNLLSHHRVGTRLDPKVTEWYGTDTSKDNMGPSVWLVFHV